MSQVDRPLVLIQRRRTFFDKYSLGVLVVFCFLLPTIMMLARVAVQSHNNRVQDWLPQSYTETQDLAEFRKHFAADQFVVVSWPGCKIGGDPQLADPTTDDPRIEAFAKLLTEGTVPNTADLVAATPVSLAATGGDDEKQHPSIALTLPKYVSEVTTARRTLDQMTAGNNGLPYLTASRRLNGTLIGPDESTSCVIVQLTNEAIGNFREILGRPASGWLRILHEEGLLFRAMRECGIDPETAVIGGPPVDNVSIDEEGQRTLLRLAGLAGLLGLTLAWFSLRSLPLTAMVFACGIVSAAMSLALVAIMGDHTDAIMFSMPPLVYVLAISGAVHLINYYRQAVIDDGVELAAETSLKMAWKPALLCSVTTALGLLSLCTSDLVPIRKFGLYAAAGVVLMLITLFLLLPAMLKLWPIRSFAVNPNRAQKVRLAMSLDRFWDWLGRLIIRRYAIVGAVCLAFIAWMGWGLSHVKSSVDLMKLFGPEARILQDYHWLEENLGMLVPMEIVLRFDHRHMASSAEGSDESLAGSDQTPSLTTLDRMTLVRNIQILVERQFGRNGTNVIGPSMAVTTFLPAIPADNKTASSLFRRTCMEKNIENNFEQLCETGYLNRDPVTKDELWRISLRVAAFRDIDYGKFVSDLRNVIDPYVEKSLAAKSRPADSVDLTYTGVIPIVYKAQRSLLASLIESTWWSFATITPLLMLVCRGFLAGLVSMLPNILPVVAIFGAMGWLGIPIDIGSMMAASIALGVAVDDTIHYMTWFRHELNETGCRQQAILGSFRHCATPTLQAAMISGLGLSVFAFSTFMPTRKFGYLMLTILVAGMIAELILLPALLSSPLGRVFKPGKPKNAVDEELPIATLADSTGRLRQSA